VTVASDATETHEHAASEPPDPRRLFARLAAFSARRHRAVIVTWLLVAFVIRHRPTRPDLTDEALEAELAFDLAIE
jgi:hypothetical protein